MFEKVLLLEGIPTICSINVLGILDFLAYYLCIIMDVRSC